MNEAINVSGAPQDQNQTIQLALVEARKNPSFINYWNAYKKIQSLGEKDLAAVGQPVVRIAILSSFTVDPLLACLDVDIRLAGLAPQSFLADFNQFRQQILEPTSDLYNYKPKLTVLLADIEAFVSKETLTTFVALNDTEKEKLVTQVLSEIRKLAQTFQKCCKGLLLINNFIVPTFSPLGIIDTKEKLGVKDFYRKLNNSLCQEFRTNSQVFVMDLDNIAASFGKDAAVNPKTNYLGSLKYSNAFFVALSNEYLGFLKAAMNLSKKCIIVDLDNTLWGGIVGEDGINGIILANASPGNEFVDFQRLLLSYYHRGVILGINSKNNYDDAIQVIREHPSMVLREKHFAIMKINWQNKVQNLIEIASELEIGLDSIVFIDDNPVERDLVRQGLPLVQVVEMPESSFMYRRTIEKLNDFSLLSFTEEDKKRGELYEARAKRKDLQHQYTSIDDYIANLGITVAISNVDDRTKARIARLINKTNQFNLTSRRHAEPEVEQMISNPEAFALYSLEVKDKFGDEGIVGAAIARRSSELWTIDTFLMSCRVIGRKIEEAFLTKILIDAQDSGADMVLGEYLPTKKNSMVASFYKERGFEKVPNSDTKWSIRIKGRQFEYPKFLNVEKSN